jgi:hypothetical protein
MINGQMQLLLYYLAATVENLQSSFQPAKLYLCSLYYVYAWYHTYTTDILRAIIDIGFPVVYLAAQLGCPIKVLGTYFQ